MLRETGTESVDMPYYTAVRWLSCGKVLSRVFELRKEIAEFLAVKGKHQALLSDKLWICKLAFAADTTGHINILNRKLQGEENLISDFFTHLKAFRHKLDLLLKQIQVMNLTKFKNCKEAMVEANTDFPLSFA